MATPKARRRARAPSSTPPTQSLVPQKFSPGKGGRNAAAVERAGLAGVQARSDATGPVDRAASFFSMLELGRHARLAWLFTLLFGIFVRWSVGLGPYSGYNTPPKYGDFEAQRHWGEITTALPASQWYFYDPTWWGLDYPPLSAYHAWVLGKIGNWLNPNWFAFETSRGIEGDGIKNFMRASAVISELLVYVPAVWLFMRTYLRGESSVVKNATFFLVLLQPGLIIIDHGHFQFNAVMLGLVTLALVMFMRGRYLAGSASFVSALFFKQMSLYYALPIFFYLLGRCLRRENGFALLVSLGATVVTTAGIYLLPFLNSTLLSQLVSRVFPLHRGLYEDKVANVWCAISVVVKLRQMFDHVFLLRVSAVITLLGTLPSGLHCFYHAFKSPLTLANRLLPYAVFSGSMSFFLFSFQERAVCVALVNVAMFSMHPLLVRDGLSMQYIVLVALWNWLNGPWLRGVNVRSAWLASLVRVGIIVSHIGIIAIHVLDMTVAPPKRYPHLWYMANMIWSCGCFFAAWIYMMYRQIAEHGLSSKIKA